VAGFCVAELAEMELTVFHPWQRMEKSRAALEAKTRKHDLCWLPSQSVV